MKSKQLGTDIATLEIDPNDFEDTPEEIERENKRALNSIEKEKESLEETQSTDLETKLEIMDIVGSEERNAKALEILEKERQLQEERELEWKKEKRSKKIKRNIKLFLIVGVIVMLALAWTAGYRIPIPDEWVQHIRGIYETAYKTVVSYFSGN